MCICVKIIISFKCDLHSDVNIICGGLYIKCTIRDVLYLSTPRCAI